MEREYRLTRSQLVAALRQWDADAVDGDWKPRDDEDRHDASADYLLSLIAAQG